MREHALRHGAHARRQPAVVSAAEVDAEAAIKLHIDVSRREDQPLAIDDNVGALEASVEEALRLDDHAALHPEVRRGQRMPAQHAAVCEAREGQVFARPLRRRFGRRRTGHAKARVHSLRSCARSEASAAPFTA